MGNSTDEFIGRPGVWHAMSVTLDHNGGKIRKLVVKGTGQVQLSLASGESREECIPIPQVHRLMAVLVENDVVALGAASAGDGRLTLTVVNADGERAVHAAVLDAPVPGFVAIRDELYAIVDALFPDLAKKPGLFGRLFGRN